MLRHIFYAIKVQKERMHFYQSKMHLLWLKYSDVSQIHSIIKKRIFQCFSAKIIVLCLNKQRTLTPESIHSKTNLLHFRKKHIFMLRQSQDNRHRTSRSAQSRPPMSRRAKLKPAPKRRWLSFRSSRMNDYSPPLKGAPYSLRLKLSSIHLVCPALEYISIRLPRPY